MRSRVSLADELFDEGYRFDFFQALKILDAVHEKEIGGEFDPVDRLAHVIRLRALPSLSFPASSIHRVGRPGLWDGDTRTDPVNPPLPAVTMTFFGLTGPNGTLPIEYTDLLCRLCYSGGVDPFERTALRDWLDIFNHRLGLMMYSAWEKYRFPVRFAKFIRAREARELLPPESRRSAPPPDPFTWSLLSLVGLGTPALQNRLRFDGPPSEDVREPVPLARIDDLAILHYSGLFARRVPSALGLQILLANYFGVEARLEEFSGQWLSFNPTTPIDLGPNGQGRLGRNTIAGQRVWDAVSRFRIVLGPLHYRDFVEFLPDPYPVAARKGFFLLSQLIRLYVGAEFDFDVQLLLLGTEVPDCVIQEVPETELGVRLGWNTWLPFNEAPEAVDDVCLEGDCRTRA
ncbi:MAG: type VI secretion system baseplate subunit TssG [Gemmataceae bacterium]